MKCFGFKQRENSPVPDDRETLYAVFENGTVLESVNQPTNNSFVERPWSRSELDKYDVLKIAEYIGSYPVPEVQS